MTSYDSSENVDPDSVVPSSWSSTRGVADALASYRRSQYIIAKQTVSSSLSSAITRDRPDLDQESLLEREEEGVITEEEEYEESISRPGDGTDMVDSLGWDVEHQPTVIPPVRPPSSPTPSAIRRTEAQHWRHLSGSPLYRHSAVRPQRPTLAERTPLLREEASKSSLTLRPSLPLIPEDGRVGSYTDGQPGLLRRPSILSSQSEKFVGGGKSTFGQTLFNSIAILLGFGMLSEPLAFAYAGWIGGSILIVSYGAITCYTAKILARIMLQDPHIHTYTDIGNKAFGQRSRFITSTLFCLELLAVSVVLMTLYGDSLHSIVPTLSANTYKLIGLCMLIPTLFLPLSVLSYASIIGILSTLLVISVVLIDGLSKPHAPGSLWQPAETTWRISSLGELGIAYGLFMAGFSGHAVLPSLTKDMDEPHRFEEMMNWAFGSATVIYSVIGGCGYLMFGNTVSDEVSQDLLATPGYSKFLNHLAMWSLVIMPLTKVSLTTRPVNITLEKILGLDASALPSSDPPTIGPDGATRYPKKTVSFTTRFFIAMERIAFACVAVAISIFIPDFSSVMAFLGAFSAFMLCVIGPVSAKVALAGNCGWPDGIVLALASIMAVWGTVALFTT